MHRGTAAKRIHISSFEMCNMVQQGATISEKLQHMTHILLGKISEILEKQEPKKKRQVSTC